MSAYTSPILIDPGSPDAALVLDRIPLGVGNGSGIANPFTEQWLQTALFRFPQALPVKEIDAHMGSLIPVCLEMQTGAGPVDIVYVTPTGQVVLVETKLWRNPEARREVVGQILDYAKDLCKLTFDSFDKAASAASPGQTSGHLVRCLLQRHPAADETAFVDGIGQCLKTGDFLLLIVGDGIRYGAETLVAFLERFGHLRFRLALLEVAAYRLPQGQVLLQPRILAKTELLEKTLLLGPNGPVAFEVAAQAEDQESPSNPQQAEFVAFWTGFLQKLSQKDPVLKTAVGPARANNQYFAMPPSGNFCWVSAYVAPSARKAGVYLALSSAYDRGADIFEMLQSDKEEIEAALGSSLTWHRTDKGVHRISIPFLPFQDWTKGKEREKIIDFLVQGTVRLVDVMKPRLLVLTQPQPA